MQLTMTLGLFSMTVLRNKKNAWFCLICLLIVLSIVETRASPLIHGTAKVIDGDTIKVNRQRIRLHGIDAPESLQSCESAGRLYNCGQAATKALSDKISHQPLSCDQLDVDRYKRIVAVCFLGEIDINQWIVSQGWAIAYRKYSKDYVDTEQAARLAKVGMWAGQFVEPWKWRRGERLLENKSSISSAETCQIKGNISKKGEKIYHVPSGRFYKSTRINEAVGEKWFCSEIEAKSAGWRKSRQ